MAPEFVADIRISRVHAPHETLVMLDFSSIPHADPIVYLNNGHLEIEGIDFAWSLDDLAGRPFNRSMTWLEPKGPIVLIHAPCDLGGDETLHFG
jgi:hypothetical protein